jgi:hypothetical protein
LFKKTGMGDMVFTLPTSVTRIQIQGKYSGNSSTFIVSIDGSSVVSEAIGTSQYPTDFDGTYLTKGGTVEITRASGVEWTFTEVVAAIPCAVTI